MNRRDRNKVLNRIKVAAKPLPISYDVVFDFSDGFCDNLLNNLGQIRASLMDFLSVSHKLPYAKAQAISAFYKSYEIIDVAGNKKTLLVDAMIDGQEASSARYVRNSPKMGTIELSLGSGVINQIIGAISHSVMKGEMNPDDQHSVILHQIEDFITQGIIHELTHATDVVNGNKRIHKEYQKDDFYFSSREEIKAHINETVYELGSLLSDMNPNDIFKLSFPEFIETSSQVYRILKDKLQINPGDDQVTVPGGTMANKKRKAWKQYLLSVYEWWTKQIERLQEAQSERRIARIQRQNFLDPVLSNLINKRKS